MTSLTLVGRSNKVGAVVPQIGKFLAGALATARASSVIYIHSNKFYTLCHSKKDTQRRRSVQTLKKK